MHQLCAPAGRALPEIVALQQQHAVAAGRRINCNSDAGCAATRDYHVPRLRVIVDATYLLGSRHIRLRRLNVKSGNHCKQLTSAPALKRFVIALKQFCVHHHDTLHGRKIVE
jgi:hypothetical protein